MLETANIRLYQIGELKRLCCALVFVFRIDTDKVRFSVKNTYIPHTSELESTQTMRLSSK